MLILPTQTRPDFKVRVCEDDPLKTASNDTTALAAFLDAPFGFAGRGGRSDVRLRLDLVEDAGEAADRRPAIDSRGRASGEDRGRGGARGGPGADAAHARHRRTLRRQELACALREHPGRRRLSRLADARIRARSASDPRRL